MLAWESQIYKSMTSWLFHVSICLSCIYEYVNVSMEIKIISLSLSLSLTRRGWEDKEMSQFTAPSHIPLTRRGMRR